MARLPGGRLRWVIAGVLVAALAAGAYLAWPHAQRYTGAAPPAQFYEKVQLEPALAQDYPRVLGVAHNAGNNLRTLAAALRYGADVIEIDVISARGRLVAGRNQPLPRLARQVFRGPALAEAWDRAAAADIIKLDLKQSDRGFLDDLIAFVAPRAKSRRVMIVSGDRDALLYLHSRLPDVTLVCSAWPHPMRSASYRRTLPSRRPSAAFRFFRAWWTRTWSPGAPAQAGDPGLDGQRRPASQPAGPAGRRRHHHGEPGHPQGPR